VRDEHFSELVLFCSILTWCTVSVQNHTMKKGKKCTRCCLSFGTDQEYKVHCNSGVIHEKNKAPNGQAYPLEADEKPIRMAKPPADARVPIPAIPTKKQKTQADSWDVQQQKMLSSSGAVNTLNRPYAPALNTEEDYTVDSFSVVLPNVKTNIPCLECDNDMSSDHFT